MNDKIKIEKHLEFGYDDLMRTVDQSCPFTLRDVLRACATSKIPMDVLCQILRCNYILDYWKEAQSKKFSPAKSDNMEYLRVYWGGDKQTINGKRYDTSGWGFDGIGKKGYVPSDVKRYGKLTKEEMEDYRSHYAIEFEPMYKLADYPIKIGEKLYMTDYDIMDKWMPKKEGDCPDIDYEVNVIPAITLVELLYAIFWELSFCGSTEERDGRFRDLVKTVKETKKAMKNGTLKLVSHEEVKRHMEKKIKNMKKSKKGKR